MACMCKHKKAAHIVLPSRGFGRCIYCPCLLYVLRAPVNPPSGPE